MSVLFYVKGHCPRCGQLCVMQVHSHVTCINGIVGAVETLNHHDKNNPLNPCQIQLTPEGYERIRQMNENEGKPHNNSNSSFGMRRVTIIETEVKNDEIERMNKKR